LNSQRSHHLGQFGIHTGVTRKVAEWIHLAFDKQPLQHLDALNAFAQSY
jgi:hypothetical protein